MSPQPLPEIPPGPADVNYPRRALSRLALSSAAAEASELAAGAVPTVSDAYGSAYETVEFAARILSSAREVLTRAVVHARELGGSWADIAEALSVTPAEAEELHKEAVQHWERALDEPVVRSGRYLSDQLPDGANNPAWHAEYLDRWCTGNARHRGTEDRMVSANLPTHTALTEMNSVLRYSLYLINRGEPITAAERDAHDVRKAAVWAKHDAMSTRTVDGDTVEHKQTRGWGGGGSGSAGVECACGTGFDGFDTIAAALEHLDRHITDADGGAR